MEANDAAAAEVERLRAENAALNRRLEEAEELIAAIRGGAVDAFVIGGPGREQVYTLETADRPYRVLVDSMRQGALTLRADGLILFCNPCFARLVNVPPERLVGTPLGKWFGPAEQSGWQRLLELGRADAAHDELDLVREDGTRVAVGVTLSPLPLHGAASLCALVTDLTEHRHYEALRRAEQALKDADRRKDEFLATLAHELRNPLSPIRNSITVLRRGTGHDAATRRLHDMIDRQVNHLVRLVDDLLDLSRVSRGKIRLTKERVALAQVIEHAVEMSNPLIESRGHALELMLPPQPIHLEGDLARLTQVLSNLLNNAAKYTDPGGRIQLLAEREPTSCRACVRIRDNGRGIDEALLGRLFDLFYQVEPSTNGADRSAASSDGGQHTPVSSIDRAWSGLGIGLPLARSLVELHGGTLEAHSPGLGCGSEFTVRLPCEPPQALQSLQAIDAGIGSTEDARRR